MPFQTLTADFKGRDGDFYSNDLLLRGPVMNISALGHMRLGDGNVDMQVGMVPFKTVNWLVAKVPLIGGGLSSDHFVAAYFHVTGPLSNPRVVPKPITSMAYFLTNVIKLPLNIIKGFGHSGGRELSATMCARATSRSGEWSKIVNAQASSMFISRPLLGPCTRGLHPLYKR